MGRREFAMRDIIELYIHWQTGESIRHIARNLGMDRKTIRKYIRKALANGYKPGEFHTKEEWTNFIKEAFPEVVNRCLCSAVFGKIEPYRELIRERLEKNTVATVWQRLCDENGLKVSLSSFRRYVNSAMPDVVSPLSVTVYRPDFPPGEEAQVDFGYLGMWVDILTGKRSKAWAFIMVLAYSRHMFVRVVHHADSHTWLDCHIRGFEFFGVPRRIVLDNLKGGVIKPDIYDPKFNRSYAEMANYYGTLIDPCRGGHPKDKPRVERMVPYVRDSFWRGRDFTTLEEANREALRWCMEVAGTRIHGTTHKRPLEAFRLEEATFMLPLPEELWEHVDWLRAKVAPDSHISVCKVLYSVPWRYIGKTLDVRVSHTTIQCYLDGELIKTHTRLWDGRRKTDPTDLPEDKVAFYQRTPQWCITQAKWLGASVAEAVEEILSVKTLYHLRQAQGIIRLSERYGAVRLNAACTRACNFGDPRYRTIKTILEKGLDKEPVKTHEDRSADISAFLHGQEEFIWPFKEDELS